MTVRAIYRAGPAYGLGHKRRALTLARALRAEPALRGVPVTILDYPGIKPDEVRRRRRQLHELVVVLGGEYDPVELTALPLVRVVPGWREIEKPPSWPPALKWTCVGPAFALLGPEYRDLPPKVIRPLIERLLITVGGADNDRALAARLTWVAAALRPMQGAIALSPGLEIRVVEGPYFSRLARARLRRLERGSLGQVEVVRRPRSLLPHLRWCDVTVTAAGATTFEAAAAGTPAVAIVAGPDQAAQAVEFSMAVNTGTLGLGPELLRDYEAGLWVLDMADTLGGALQMLGPERRQQMSLRMQQLVDGGGTDRAVSEIMRVAGV